MARPILYCTAAELLAKIPMADRDAAVDDTGSGVPDMALLDEVISQACDEVDTFYAIRGVTVPLNPAIEPLAKQAAMHIAIETLYTRRGEDPTRNPHHKSLEQIRGLLGRVADGRLSVASTLPNASSEIVGQVVSVEGEPALTYPGPNRIFM
ncbi:MAG: Protein of unknown function (DUF1320) [Verrucomicrobia bacterium]|nr:MAG: Protein of unknown function (DUF1320) [Verrucomicrobiota bacterium]